MTTLEKFDLTGRRAVITGAGSGFGRAFAVAFAEAGAEVVATGLNLEWLEETADLARKAGGTAHAIEMNVADTASVQAVAEELAGMEGGVQVLVNNAGIANAPRRVHELPMEAWTEMIDVALNGVFYCTRAMLPLMLGTGGSIINIASIAALVGIARGPLLVNSAYAAAKAGVIGFTRQTAVEYAKDGVRANAIAPGWHGGTRLGDANRKNATNEQIAMVEDAIHAGVPMGRRGTAEELAPLALYLASDASGYVTGQVFVEDGGWTAD